MLHCSHLKIVVCMFAFMFIAYGYRRCLVNIRFKFVIFDVMYMFYWLQLNQYTTFKVGLVDESCQFVLLWNRGFATDAVIYDI